MHVVRNERYLSRFGLRFVSESLTSTGWDKTFVRNVKSSPVLIVWFLILVWKGIILCVGARYKFQRLYLYSIWFISMGKDTVYETRGLRSDCLMQKHSQVRNLILCVFDQRLPGFVENEFSSFIAFWTPNVALFYIWLIHANGLPAVEKYATFLWMFTKYLKCINYLLFAADDKWIREKFWIVFIQKFQSFHLSSKSGK